MTNTATTTLDPETTTSTVVASATATIICNGNVCGAGCSNPTTCNNPNPCPQGGPCYCYSQAVGPNICVQIGSCSQGCTTSDDCGSGFTCVTSTCCGGGGLAGSNCKPNSLVSSCANTASAKMLFRSRIRAVAGYVLWEDGTYGPPTPSQ